MGDVVAIIFGKSSLPLGTILNVLVIYYWEITYPITYCTEIRVVNHQLGGSVSHGMEWVHSYGAFN